jgi:predicted DNA binding CopG/RHH family protein
MSLSKKVVRMREEYDFSKGRKNPYIKRLKKQVTMNIDCSTIEYFKDQSEESGIPYQVLIDLYLDDCVKKGIKPDLNWKEPA